MGRLPQRKRLAALVLACSVIVLTFAACSVPGVSPASSNVTGGGILIATPRAANLTPTPAFPAFTIGAWPSNYSPNVGESFTLYVLCRVQDPTMKGPSTPPPAGQQIGVTIGSPVNQSASGSTDAQGLAAIPLTINDTFAGQPVTITVSTNWKNTTYYATTFFTPSPSTPPTPTPAPTGVPGSGTATPTTGGGNGGGGGHGVPTATP